MKKMQDAEAGNGIGEPVQALPIAPEAPRHAVGRGGGQRCQPQHRQEADRQIDPQGDFRADLEQIEFLVADIEREMHRGIGEGGDPQQAAQQRQPVPAENAQRRGDRQRQQDEADGPGAEEMRRLVERQRLQRPRPPAPKQP